MDPLTQNKLDELIELTKDNNKMLRKMRRSQMWSSAVRAVYWIFILVSIYGVYKYLGPTFKSLYGAYSNAFGTDQSGSMLQNLGDYKDLQSLLNKYNIK